MRCVRGHRRPSASSCGRRRIILCAYVSLLTQAIIHISTLIKAVAVHYPFPRDLMRAVGELNQGCSTLAAELHESTQRM